MPKLPELRDDFSTLFEFLPIGAYRSRPDGTQLRVNPALARLNGFAHEREQLTEQFDIAGRWYVDPRRREHFQALMARDGRVVGFESEVWRYKTRERIWVSENAHLVRDADGEALYYEGTVEEITDRVRNREALQRSERQLHQIMGLMPGMVYRVLMLPGGARRATYVSEGCRAIFGVTAQETMVDPQFLSQYCHPDDRLRLMAEGEAARANGEVLNTEYRVRRPDGVERWVRVISAPAPSEDGVEVRIGIVIDITEQHQAAALRSARDRAEAADRAKSEFLARISHELRVPANGLQGFAQLLQMSPGGGPEQAMWVRRLNDSCRHLVSLLDDLLDLSSAQTGGLRVSREPVPMGLLLEEACGMVAAQAQSAGVHLYRAVNPGLTALGDRKRVLQIVLNLLTNAIKYNRSGGEVRVQAKALRAFNGRRQMLLSVSDNGPGLTAEQRLRLFQPFERLGAESSPVEGTGLGLALARQLAEQMGGRIDVLSQPGEGAEFRVYLPMLPPLASTAGGSGGGGLGAGA